MSLWKTFKFLFGVNTESDRPVTLAAEMKSIGKPLKVKKEQPVKFVKEVPAKKVYVKKTIADKEVFVEEKIVKKLDADLTKKEDIKPKKAKRSVEGNAKNLYTAEEWKNKKGK